MIEVYDGGAEQTFFVCLFCCLLSSVAVEKPTLEIWSAKGRGSESLGDERVARGPPVLVRRRYSIT